MSELTLSPLPLAIFHNWNREKGKMATVSRRYGMRVSLKSRAGPLSACLAPGNLEQCPLTRDSLLPTQTAIEEARTIKETR